MRRIAFAGLLALAAFVPNISAEEKLDAALLKENHELATENRIAAIKILKSLGVATSSAMPAGASDVEINHNIFVLNQMTFRQLAAKVGAKPVMVPAPTGVELVEQNHQILLGNYEVMKSAAVALKIEIGAPDVSSGTYLQKNNTLLKANKATLAKIATATSK